MIRIVNRDGVELTIRIEVEFVINGEQFSEFRDKLEELIYEYKL